MTVVPANLSKYLMNSLPKLRLSASYIAKRSSQGVDERSYRWAYHKLFGKDCRELGKVGFRLLEVE